MLQYLKVFHSLFPPISQPSLKGGCKQPTGHPPVDTLTVNYQVAQATDLWFTNCFRMSSFKHVGFQTMYGNHEFPPAWNQEQNSGIVLRSPCWRDFDSTPSTVYQVYHLGPWVKRKPFPVRKMIYNIYNWWIFHTYVTWLEDMLPFGFRIATFDDAACCLAAYCNRVLDTIGVIQLKWLIWNG